MTPARATSRPPRLTRHHPVPAGGRLPSACLGFHPPPPGRHRRPVALHLPPARQRHPLERELANGIHRSRLPDKGSGLRPPPPPRPPTRPLTRTTPTVPVTVSSVVLGPSGAPSLLRGCTWAEPWWVFGHNDWYAVRVPGACVLIDPDGVGDTDVADGTAHSAPSVWEPHGQPLAFVPTTDQHERSAYSLRERFSAPVWAPEGGFPIHGGDLEGTPDQTYRAGSYLPGGLRAI